MNESIPRDDEDRLRQYLLAALAPDDPVAASDAELDELMEELADETFAEDRLEFLLEKVDVMLREAPQGPAPAIGPSYQLDGDPVNSPLHRPPVLGFLGGLMKGDTWPNISTFSGYMIAALTAISLTLAVAVVLLVVAFLSKARPKAIAVKHDARGVACLSRLNDVVWAGPEFALSEMDRLSPGQEIKLDAGRAEINFDAGVQMVIEGPAHVRILGRLKTQACLGSITARVGKDAHGFSIITPRGKVVDLGTEFGLRLDDSGHQDVVVFEGGVDVEYDSAKNQGTSSGPSPSQTRHLVAGEAVRLGPEGDLTRLGSITGETFPRVAQPSPARQPVIEAVSDNIRLPENAQFYEIVHGGLNDGARAYVDRIYTWRGTTGSGLPQALRGADYVKTFNNDKLRQDYKISVQLAGAADLYLFTDDRVPVPDWVRKQFQPTGWKIDLAQPKPIAQPKPRIVLLMPLRRGQPIRKDQPNPGAPGHPALPVRLEKEKGLAKEKNVERIIFSVWRQSVAGAQTVALGQPGMAPEVQTKKLKPTMSATWSMYGFAAVPRPQASRPQTKSP